MRKEAEPTEILSRVIAIGFPEKKKNPLFRAELVYFSN